MKKYSPELNQLICKIKFTVSIMIFSAFSILSLTSVNAADGNCHLLDAVYRSGNFTLQFGLHPDCKDTKGYCSSVFSMKVIGNKLTINGYSQIPNGFARQFYVMDFQNVDQVDTNRIGGFYFISTNEKGQVKPTNGEISILDFAPPAVVLPEFSRELYYSQRDKIADLEIPPSDIFVYDRCN